MRIDEILSLLMGVKQGATGWTARCPAHDDHENSLSVTAGDDGKILVHCFAGCSVESIVKALGLEVKDLFSGPRQLPGDGQASDPSAKGGTSQPLGLTLKELCARKKLPLELLRQHGIQDFKYCEAPAVRIPYFSPDGQILAVRFRIGMDGQRFVWRSGDKTTLYGLEQLDKIRAGGWVLLVEGESDCWTAWYYGLPALGIPGKTNWKESWRAWFVGLDVYLWQEPGAEDLTRRVSMDIPKLRVVFSPNGFKDISEAHLAGTHVAQFVADLKARAVPADQIRREVENARVAKLKNKSASILSMDDPLVAIKEAFKVLGYGGDDRYATITYLACTSRLLSQRTGSMPVHLLLVGAPSSGKSYTLGVVLKLLPKCAFHTIDAGTPRVLIYDVAELKHRVTVFSEADSLPAGEDNPAASAIRNLLQDHHLHYKVPVRDPETGDFVVREVKKEGPSVLITTSTRRLGAQLDSRLFTLEIPDDHARVQEALLTQAQIELEGTREPDPVLVAFQDYLQAKAPWDVLVPFAQALADAIGKLPSAARILRDFQRLLSLVKAVAVLRHAHRVRDPQGRVIATLDDYATVYALIQEMYESTASGASKRLCEVVAAVAAMNPEGKSPVSVSEVAQKLGVHRSSVSRQVSVALRNGWLCNTQSAKGKPAQLTSGEALPPPSGLPEPGSVAVLQPKPPDVGGWVEGRL